jgi:hypothetical protein
LARRDLGAAVVPRASLPFGPAFAALDAAAGFTLGAPDGGCDATVAGGSLGTGSVARRPATAGRAADPARTAVGAGRASTAGTGAVAGDAAAVALAGARSSGVKGDAVGALPASDAWGGSALVGRVAIGVAPDANGCGLVAGAAAGGVAAGPVGHYVATRGSLVVAGRASEGAAQPDGG